MTDDERRRKGGGGYAVGYGKPPIHSRFKPGQSGNPRGRQKGGKSYKETVGEIFNERITVHTPQGTKRMTKLTALAHTNMNNALKGDAKATDRVLKMARDAGLVEEAAGTFDEIAMKQLSEQDKAILERYSLRRGGGDGEGGGE